MGALYEGFSTTDGITSVTLSSTSFNGFMIALPVSTPSGVVVGAGITPFSSVNYKIIAPSQHAGLIDTLRYAGDGGLSLAHLGFSASVGPELHIGIKMNYYFGTLHHTVTHVLDPALYTNAEVKRSTQVSGVGFTFGLVHTGLKRIFNLPESHALNLGFIFTTISSLSTTDERIFTFTTSSLTTRDTGKSTEGTLRLPLAFGAGLSYLSDRFLLAGDFHFQKWERFTINDVPTKDLRNNYRVGFGGELLPKHEAVTPFIQRFAYRLGFFYDASYYKIKGEPINEVGFTGGVGIPILSDTRLNIAAEYSFRGTTNRQLQKDKILRISFTISGGELWFVRPDEE